MPGVAPQRHHVLVDIEGAERGVLNDGARLEALLITECETGGATILDSWRHAFEPEGVTVLVGLAESHASIHTWPTEGQAFVDVFTCGDVDPWHIARGIARGVGGTPSFGSGRVGG